MSARPAAAAAARASAPRRCPDAGAFRMNSRPPDPRLALSAPPARARHRCVFARRRRRAPPEPPGSRVQTGTDRSSAPRQTPRRRPTQASPSRRAGGRRARSCPHPRRTSPSSIRSSVVLPAPLGPSRPLTSPSSRDQVDPVDRTGRSQTAWSSRSQSPQPCRAPDSRASVDGGTQLPTSQAPARAPPVGRRPRLYTKTGETVAGFGGSVPPRARRQASVHPYGGSHKRASWPATRGCGSRSGGGTSATRCRGTARGSTGS